MGDRILGSLEKGLLFVLSAPAGTGKTTLMHMLKEEFHTVIESVSCTTRDPRIQESDGKDYHFLTLAQFQAKVEAGDFLEYAEVFGNYYGTSKDYVLKQQENGKHVILVIDTQGAMQIKKKLPAVFIFISPPSLEELRARLFKRKTETPESIERRLFRAKKEIEMADQYDYHIINKNLNVAYEVLRSILIAEEHRSMRR